MRARGVQSILKLVVHQEVVFCQESVLFGESEFERGRGVPCKYGVKYTTMMFSPAFITVLLSGFDLRGYDRLIGRSGDGCYAYVKTVPSANTTT